MGGCGWRVREVFLPLCLLRLVPTGAQDVERQEEEFEFRLFFGFGMKKPRVASSLAHRFAHSTHHCADVDI